MSILEFWKNDVKMYDLTVNLSHQHHHGQPMSHYKLSSSKD